MNEENAGYEHYADVKTQTIEAANGVTYAYVCRRQPGYGQGTLRTRKRPTTWRPSAGTSAIVRL
ncbi:hypothetical protein [Streptomyces sp. CoH27]|uniref:hypothetical protein n=1 Tax=Streptomyces sp. CoH27 TaxID=2875763 RepID=UPI001CD736CB|nr:hypothetical protein [Streptomyces sp. CoH27]